MRLFISLFVLAGILLLGGCDLLNGIDDFRKNEETNFSNGWFPEDPVNIEALNTEWDDFNSNIPVIGKTIDFYFSNNQNSQGGQFDISNRQIGAYFNYQDSIFNFSVGNTTSSYAFHLLPLINSQTDELGPFSFETDTIRKHSKWIFLYANNNHDHFDIQFAYTFVSDWGGWDSQRKIYGPFSAPVLNSSKDDFYPTINKEQSKFYFSSNRDKTFSIYEVNISEDDVVKWLQTGNEKPKLIKKLSSPHNDKCPYINGNLLVFASDSPAGYGGFDLWYSVFENGDWSEPRNFGPRINTEFDEYRPAIQHFPDSNNDLMVFSSNRPGGKGGFDLYYTGISKMIHPDE